MSKILFRQSGGPIGDMFFTAHYMYHQKVLGNKVFAAIPHNLNSEIRSIYSNFTFIDGILELPFFSDDKKFLKFCSDSGYLPCRYLLELKYLKDLKFYPFDLWFKDDTQPTIDTFGAVGFQISSASNYDRPKILYIQDYLMLVERSGLRPVFFGVKEDEELFSVSYPEIYDRYHKNSYCWRFGKDTLLQTIANIKNLFGHVVFSSGTSPLAVFQGVPTLELWNNDQWQFFSPMVHYMMGSPIHHLTQSAYNPPSVNLVENIFPRAREMCSALYGI